MGDEVVARRNRPGGLIDNGTRSQVVALDPKELSVYIGHSDVRTTFNRYGHLMPGGEKEAVAKLDAFFGGRASNS